MIRLEKLIIRKLGNIAPNTKLHFGKRGALLLGKNGTGKTTLLNVVAAVLTSNWRQLNYISSDFDIELEIIINSPPLSDLHLKISAKNSPSPDKSRIQEILDPIPDEILIEGHVLNSHGISVRLDLEANGDQKRTGSIAGIVKSLKPPSDSPIEYSISYSDELSKLANSLVRLDEGDTYFEALTNDYPGPNELVAFFSHGGTSSTTFRSHLISQEIISQFIEDTANLQAVIFEAATDSIKLLDSHPANWLGKFCELCTFDEASLSISLISRRSERSYSEATYGPLNILYKTHNTTLPERWMSFGQKRLFSILHYLEANPSIAVADELVNGMHHEWIGYCVERFQARQAFLSTQNPLLFDFWSFESAQDAAECFIECSCDNDGRFVWRNMPIDDAIDFYAIYQTGIQHVSDILRTRGYW